MSTPSKPTFARKIRGTMKALKRPNCLNFKTKSNLEIPEVIEILKQTDYPISILVGLAGMKGRIIDVTSRTGGNV